MKYIKLFEDYDEDGIQDDIQDVEKERVRPYANGEKIDDVILVDAGKDFNDNPLFYVWSEYPKYHLTNGAGLVKTSYEFYRDKDKNMYFVAGTLKEFEEGEIANLIAKHDWNYARNVDAFVDGADKDDYKHWLDLIS